MVNPDTARTVVGIIGNVISGFLFLSPAPTLYKIYKQKSVQSFKADPYLATILNCAMWLLYGLPLVHPNSTLVLTINGAGFAIEAFYVTIFFIYADWPKRRKWSLILVVEAVFFAIMAIITLVALHGTKTRSTFVGALCIIFNIAMYASPLTVMRRVIKTKSVKFMPFYLSVANLANGIVWTIYALIRFDVNILVPNGLGSLSGVVQLILYAAYYKTAKWDEDGSHETEIELQSPKKRAEDHTA